MFTPSRDDVRLFFCTTYGKHINGTPLTALEAVAADWIAEHPEHHTDLQNEAEALAAVFSVQDGKTNPFLHLSMHLSISEQISIDQPRGIKAAFEALRAQRGSAHQAQHDVMECLGDMMWTSQRSGLPPDGEKYIDCVRRRASR